MADDAITELRQEMQELRREMADLRTTLLVDAERHVYCRDTLVPQLAKDVDKLKTQAKDAERVQDTVAKVGNFAVTVVGALCVAGIVGLVVFGLDLFRQFRR